jgi:hypothetical protein
MPAQGYTAPARRSLQIFAFDPMIARTERRRLTLQVKNEPLLPGPCSRRVHVIDYDGSARVLYEPVDLDDPAVLMNEGLTPTESDPRFHQQMVYAVTMRVMENFELALGRKLTFRTPLRIYPHAFEGANAFYQPPGAILFGYFRADETDPGPNLPGQTVFTCLSHDIIAHEVTHALVHRLRKRYHEATNRDVLAFHEGFADIVAIFQHFSFRDVLADTIQQTRSNLRSDTPLIQLAQQFGYATGSGRALRSAVEDGKADPRQYQTLLEPHDRGSILVAAVFDAFFTIYQRRIADLIRIATGGSGTLPDGNLHPDLVKRLVREAAKTSQQVLTMCIRAIEYMPPMDITYGDFLRAIVTADYDMVPDDEAGLRAAMVEAFRVRGIYPDDVQSLAEDSLIHQRGPQSLKLPEEIHAELADAAADYEHWDWKQSSIDFARRSSIDDSIRSRWAGRLISWAQAHAATLGLDPTIKPALLGFHTVLRVSPSGRLVSQLVVQLEQHDKGSLSDPDFGGIAFRGGCTIIADGHGDVLYIVRKPMTQQRRDRQRQYVHALDVRDAALGWCEDYDKYAPQRMSARTSFAALHRGLV